MFVCWNTTSQRWQLLSFCSSQKSLLLHPRSCLSLVQMHGIVPDFQVKHKKKPKPTTFRRHPSSCRINFLSSGKRVIILMSAWAESVAYFKTDRLWVKTSKYYLTSPAHKLHVRVPINVSMFVCCIFLINMKTITYNDVSHFLEKRKESKLPADVLFWS